MNKSRLRIFGVILTVLITALPMLLFFTYDISSKKFITNSQKLLISKRSLLDKKIPLVIQSKLQEFNQTGCGDPQFPENESRFFVEEKIKPKKDPIIDFFEQSLQNKKCYFSSIPEYYILDRNKNYPIKVILESTKDFNINTSIVSKIKGQVSLSKGQYTINGINNVYTVTPTTITVENQILYLSNTRIYNFTPNTTVEDESTLDFNQNMIEVLGEI